MYYFFFYHLKLDNKLQTGKQNEIIEVDFDDPITLTFKEKKNYIKLMKK